MQSQCVVKQRKWDRFLFRIVPYVFNALQYMNNLNVIAGEISVISRSVLMGHEIDVYGTIEEPFFKANDVAAWLELSNVSDMVSRVEEDERSKFNLGRQGETWFLSENGLYEVFFQSRKPIAREFKKGVKEILKQIRKTGEFKTKQVNSPQVQNQILTAKMKVAS